MRSVLCVEPRHGVLFVFMPPVERLDDGYLMIGKARMPFRRVDGK